MARQKETRTHEMAERASSAARSILRLNETCRSAAAFVDVQPALKDMRRRERCVASEPTACAFALVEHLERA